MNTLAPAIDQLFSPSITCCYIPVNDHTNQLFPQEHDLIANSVKSRQREFSSGRWCARQVMLKLGLEDSALLVGPDREPLWPPEITGSISHTSSWSICVAAPTNTVAGLGVDVEQLSVKGTLPRQLVLTQTEQDWLSGNSTQSHADLELLIFSAKESVYKALFPLCGRYIDYLEVGLRLDLQKHRFQVEYCSTEIESFLQNFSLQGHYCRFDNHIWSGVTLLEK